MKRKEIEYAIQKRENNVFVDIPLYTFNKHNCLWEEPIEEWGKKILDAWYYLPRLRDKYGKSVRLVKRITTEEIIH